jgi:hypothetical protein
VPHVLELVGAQTPPPDTVGPGVGGFLAIFALALATVLLIRSMVGHLRKVRYGPGPDADDEGAGDQGTGDQGTGDQGTGDQGTGDQGTGDAPSDRDGSRPPSA